MTSGHFVPQSVPPHPQGVRVDDFHQAQEGADDLIGATLEVTSQLDMDQLLGHVVVSAHRLTGARFAALGVLDSQGNTTSFVHSGMKPGKARLLPHPPVGEGVFALIPSEGHLILDDLRSHPAFDGFPAHHPEMKEFLGVAVRIRGRIFGRLYLASKKGGFSEQDAQVVTSLAAAAAVAIENSRMYTAARSRERWLTASQEITTALLEGTEEEDALAMIAQRVRQVAAADTSLIILPSVGDTWAGEFADGHRAEELLGVVFPPEGRAMTVLRGGVGVIVDSLERSPMLRVAQLRGFGPALYAPMMLRGSGMGVLLVLRETGQPEFEDEDLTMAESLASQAALALELASARHAEDLATLLDERERIARDLHDLAIQQLFATGMELEAVRKKFVEGGPHMAAHAQMLETALALVDSSVTQIRSIVHDLREPDAAVDLVERLRREASLARNGLGFAPSLVVNLDGVTATEESDEEIAEEIHSRVNSDISDDVVAAVREGLSNAGRHARASSVQVHVSVEGAGLDGFVTVRVIDDGRGVDPEVTRRSGLGNLAVRARRHGGNFLMRPGPSGRGTELTWRAPLT